MIRVNLLPDHLRPVRRSLVPYLLSGGVLVIALLAMASIFVAKQADIIRRNAELASLNNQLKTLDAVITEWKHLEAMGQQLETQVETIEEITRDRIIWSEQLARIGGLTPPNVWYSRIALDKKTFKETQTVRDSQGQLQTKEIPVVKPILRLEGYIVRLVTDQGELAMDVNPLMRAMENDPDFSEMFRLEPPSFTDTMFQNHPVRKFTLECVIQGRGPAS